ncbi:MAG: SPOR domain-containing protein [Neorhizobium sp.]|nr:SPOR domain-containing protein [Neorhizobium sp.]
MADNNLARSRNDGPEIFADDDPLAQLARIVGYEDRVVGQPDYSARPASQLADPQSAFSAAANSGATDAGYGRREPAFNLEDELLREFERYDAPRLDPANDIPLDAPQFSGRNDHGHADQVAPVEEAPVAYAPEPVFEPAAHEPVPPAPEAIHADRFYADDHRRAVEPVDPAFEHPEPAADFHWQAEPAGPVEPIRHHQAEVYQAPVADPVMPRVEPSYEPVAEKPHEIDMFDLAAELESSMGVADDLSQHDLGRHEPAEPAYVAPVEASAASVQAAPLADPVEAAQVASQPVVKRNTGYTPGFRMPLANFNLHQGTTSLMREPAPLAPAPLAAAAAPVMDEVPASPVSDAPKMVEPVLDAPKPSDKFSAMDELLYDVERFAQPAKPAGLIPMTSLPGVTIPGLSTSGLSIPVGANPGASIPSLGATMAVAAPAATAPVARAPVVSEPDPFADEDFELALDDLELDLADVVAENNRGPVMAAPAVSVAPPVSVAPAAPQPRVEPAVYAPAPVAPAPVEAAPIAAMPAAVELSSMQDDLHGETDLPFDPALLSETEDHPEAITDLNVPDLPVEEPEQEIAYTPDYDIDIDAELATLLSEPEPSKPAAASAKAATAMTGAVAGAAAAGAAAHSANAAGRQPAAGERQAYSDLDEFERALEEDFRRSLANPLPAGGRDEDRYVAEVDDERPRRSMRSWAIPVVALGVVVLLGGGAYALLGGGVSKMVGSGEPVVIAADKDPVKVVPENPGGKTVPNQDKAVYDRVAGTTSEAPKQQQLISSDEQPMDVVQKTLMPDTLPTDGDGEADATATDASDTTDPRLLPQQQGNQDIAVAPRKVKTMIVRADGTLVEQDAPASATPALAAPTGAKLAATAASPAQSVSGQSTPAPSQGMPSPASAIQASAPVADAVDSGPAVRAPVPSARPSQPAANARPAAPTQVAQAAAQPVAASPAQAAATPSANAAKGGYFIQVASLPSQAEAQKSYQSISAKFGSVVSGRGVDIKAAEIAGKGTFYRVRIPAGSKADAIALCERYRSAGGSCLVAQ